MKKTLAISAAFALSACSGHSVGPGGGARGGDVTRAELRQAPAIAAARLDLRGGVAAAARSYLGSQRGALGLASQDAFAVLRTHVSLDGVDHVRLQQLHDGIKVWGADVVAHIGADQLLGVDGNLLGSVAGLDLAPSVADTTAASAAKADYAAGARAGEPLAYDREGQELVILPLDDGSVRLAWHVSFHT